MQWGDDCSILEKKPTQKDQEAAEGSRARTPASASFLPSKNKICFLTYKLRVYDSIIFKIHLSFNILLRIIAWVSVGSYLF